MLLVFVTELPDDLWMETNVCFLVMSTASVAHLSFKTESVASVECYRNEKGCLYVLKFITGNMLLFKRPQILQHVADLKLSILLQFFGVWCKHWLRRARTLHLGTAFGVSMPRYLFR